MDVTTVHIGLDIVIMAAVAGAGLYGLRSFTILLRYHELKDVGRLWLPGLSSGFFFFLWSLEDFYFDIYESQVGLIITNATLLVAVLLFSLGVVRFSRIWLDYAKKRDESTKQKGAF